MTTMGELRNDDLTNFCCFSFPDNCPKTTRWDFLTQRHLFCGRNFELEVQLNKFGVLFKYSRVKIARSSRNCRINRMGVISKKGSVFKLIFFGLNIFCKSYENHQKLERKTRLRFSFLFWVNKTSEIKPWILVT